MSTPVETPVDDYPNPFEDRNAVMTEETNERSAAVSSAEGSRPQSRGRDKKKRVGFGQDRISWVEHPTDPLPDITTTDTSPIDTPNPRSRQSSGDPLIQSSPGRSHAPDLSAQQTAQIHRALTPQGAAPRPRPAIRHTPTGNTPTHDDEDADESDEHANLRKAAARKARSIGLQHERKERIRSEPNSRLPSPSPSRSKGKRPLRPTDDIQMMDLAPRTVEDTDDDDEDDVSLQLPVRRRESIEAQRLVRKHTMGLDLSVTPGLESGTGTPTENQAFFGEDRPNKPANLRSGILGAILKLHTAAPTNLDARRPGSAGRIAHHRTYSGDTAVSSAEQTPAHSPTASGASTPTGNRPNRSWFTSRSQSSSSLAQLVGSTTALGTTGGLAGHASRIRDELSTRPGLGKRSRSADALTALHRLSRPKIEKEIKIKEHIADIISRQRYLMKLCKALMQYGAPTHRLEDYMQKSAAVLEIQAQFLYIPGAMIMSFDDIDTHTTEVKLVKVEQGLDLGKLRDVHEIYKDVVHDNVSAGDATVRLKTISKKPKKHRRLVLIPVYGLAAACVGPFAFGANVFDLGPAFVLGCLLGVLQLYIAPMSSLYANVFEIFATVVTSFLARWLGSFRGGELFCFAALAQSSIALILPGYTVLCAALELQSRSIVAGSVRMVYAIMYSFFLGYGITLGTTIYGAIDHNATSETQCRRPMPGHWGFIFVPLFAMCLIIINQAKWKQAPFMLFLAFVGYLVNFYSSKRFAGNTQIANTLGAFTIGVLANASSRFGSRWTNKALDLWEDRLRPRWKKFKRATFRIKDKVKTPQQVEQGEAIRLDDESVYERSKRRVGYGLAAAAMLPAIFVQVPSGLAVSGSLVAGIASANQIVGNATNGTSVVNSTTLTGSSSPLNGVALNVSYSVIQVAIGITVGLFFSAIVVYPWGKKGQRSGLFSL